MHSNRNLLIVLLLAFTPIFGCATKHHREVISYFDRNDDGRIDLEQHSYPGTFDADWDYVDTDFDGRYDKLVSHGMGAPQSNVNLTVPVGAKITPNK